MFALSFVFRRGQAQTLLDKTISGVQLTMSIWPGAKDPFLPHIVRFSALTNRPVMS